MSYSHEDVQLAILGSRSLNEMKADIIAFVAMFVSPYDKTVIGHYGKFEELKLNGGELRIRTRKGGFSVVVENHMGSFCCSIEKLHARHIEEVWLNLHVLLDELVELVPEIEGNIDFFRGIGQRVVERNTSH